MYLDRDAVQLEMNSLLQYPKRKFSRRSRENQGDLKREDMENINFLSLNEFLNPNFCVNISLQDKMEFNNLVEFDSGLL